jgi:diguanylate cyclase (GGDEF)-like protein
MHEVIGRLDRREKFAFIYADIDNFKAYNDKYGFQKGDTVIQYAAETIKNNLAANDFLGHIGGDDFILVCAPEKAEPVCQAIIRSFENGITRFYSPQDVKQGYIVARNRQGAEQRYPLMSLSIGITTNKNNEDAHYGQLVEVATEMKKVAKLKQAGKGSSISVDQRK